MGEVRRAELRSAREQHMIVFAPTGAGKTTRVVGRAVREHDGPMIVGLNKLDALYATLAARQAVGPVWVFAPLSDLSAFGPDARSCCWSPLTGCESWSGALQMAQWLYDADPHAAQSSQGSGGARFYNREAVEALLPALLHAAALGGRGMVDVLGWLRGGLDALDVARDTLVDHAALPAAHALAGVQQLDDRPRSLLVMSAAQLVSAYRLPEVAAIDGPGFDVGELLAENGTLYLIAPESQQEALAPLFGGILGEALRTAEINAARVSDPRTLPVLKLVMDEAAHLAPLTKLPNHLAVSRGWGCRWMLVYQSVAQLRHRYGQEADSVLGNALPKLFMGPIHDASTRQELMGLLGGESVTQTSRTHDSWGARRSTTEQEHERTKLAAHELAQLGDGDGVLIHGRDLPARVRLPFWWEIEGAHTPDEAHDREFDRQRREREERSR
jgi:type IV secretion system protein VirD4